MGQSWLRDRRRIVELAVTAALAGVIVWQYGGRAPQVIIVLSFLLSLVVALVQLPFLAGYYGVRRFKLVLVCLLISLPFLIALGYRAVYQKDLFLILYEEWIGTAPSAAAAAAILLLPVIAYLFGRLGGKSGRT